MLPRTGAMEHYANSVVSLCLRYDFEPHGRASETWEDVWFLTLHTIPHHWMSTTGWRLGTTPDGICFSGRTEEEVRAMAIGFVEWWKDNHREGT